MIVFPHMLINAAKKANMLTPENPDNFDASEFPHFSVFCKVQLARPMRFPNEHYGNAKVIANFTEYKIKVATLADLISAGLVI